MSNTINNSSITPGTIAALGKVQKNSSAATPDTKSIQSTSDTSSSSSKVDLSEKAQSLASQTLDKSEIGKLLSLTKPSANKEAIKSGQSGLDAYLALSKNKLF